MFTMSLKGTSNLTYTFLGVDMKVKAKFKGSTSKIRNWRSNFLMMKKCLLADVVEDETLTP